MSKAPCPCRLLRFARMRRCAGPYHRLRCWAACRCCRCAESDCCSRTAHPNDQRRSYRRYYRGSVNVVRDGAGCRPCPSVSQDEGRRPGQDQPARPAASPAALYSGTWAAVAICSNGTAIAAEVTKWHPRSEAAAARSTPRPRRWAEPRDIGAAARRRAAGEARGKPRATHSSRVALVVPLGRAAEA
jgi:hypothetical protein